MLTAMLDKLPRMLRVKIVILVRIRMLVMRMVMMPMLTAMLDKLPRMLVRGILILMTKMLLMMVLTLMRMPVRMILGRMRMLMIMILVSHDAGEDRIDQGDDIFDADEVDGDHENVVVDKTVVNHTNSF